MYMKLTVISTGGKILFRDGQYDAAVVLDVLRATTTITTALAKGCRQVIPVAQVEEAVKLAAQDTTALLCGERGAVKLPGFTLGNSPLEYTRKRVAGQKIILTTTNGTGAIQQAARQAPVVLIGSLLNARAVARRLADYSNVLLLCAGTKGQFSLEDTLAAGWVIKELLALKGGENYSGRALAAVRAQGQQVYGAEVPLEIPHSDQIVMDDGAVAAYRLALYYRHNTLDALYDSLHGQKLAQLGMTDDLNYCAQLNIMDVVPCYHAGIISTQLAIK